MTPDEASREAYIDLLKRSLQGTTVGPTELLAPLPHQGVSVRHATLKKLTRPFAGDRPSVRKALLERMARLQQAVLARRLEFDVGPNVDGTYLVWRLPPWSMTMVGARRLDNVHACVRDVVERGVPGDLIETGVWRGGTSIFMRGLLRAYGDTTRRVYVADSFQGVPPPDVENYPSDEGLDLHLWIPLAVSAEEVRANFERYGLLDDRVIFVEGWFRDTLPGLRDRSWSVLRLDGDLYESTRDSLTNLYPGLSPGGWVIIDDYEIEACAEAVTDFRREHEITEEIVTVDATGVCWRKRS